MGNTLVDYRTEAGVATIKLCDPPMNAFTYEMMKDLDDAILDARFDNDVHVIVITGYGERFFSAGANIKMLSEVDPAFKYYFCLHANETLTRLENTPKLVIAAMNGHAVGGGLEIALGLRSAHRAQRRGQIGLPETSTSGWSPGTGGTQRLARLVGKSRATADDGRRNQPRFRKRAAVGLVNEVWEAPHATRSCGKVIEYARKPSRRKSAGLRQRIKRALQAGLEMSLEQAAGLRTRATRRAQAPRREAARPRAVAAELALTVRRRRAEIASRSSR